MGVCVAVGVGVCVAVGVCASVRACVRACVSVLQECPGSVGHVLAAAS